MLLSLAFVHFLESLGIGRAYEVGLHVIDPALGVHQVLLLLSLDLDHPHDHPIDHVDGLPLLISLLFPLLTLVLNVILLLV